jgi:glycosyltransferase involved in cell wall biosynthesis
MRAYLCAALCALVAALVLRAHAPPPPPLRTPPPPGQLRGARVLIITHDASASGAPRACVEIAQALAGLGADVSLAVQGRAAARRADRKALVSLLAPVDSSAAAFSVVGLTPSAVREADVVIVSTAVAPNSAWIAAAAAAASAATSATAVAAEVTNPSWAPRGLAGLVDSILDLAALAMGTSRASAAHMRPQARLVWLVHEGGAVMRALGRPAHDAAVSALSDSHSRVDRVVFVSHVAQAWWLDQVGRRGASISAPRQAVLHWGVPRWKLEHLALSPARAEESRLRLRRQLGFATDDFVFLVVGSFHPMKGHAGIIRAFIAAQAACTLGGDIASAHRRLRLVAIGGGLGAPDYFPRMFADAERVLTLEGVRLLPATSDVSAFLAMADAFVSNTQCEGETWGLATLEALAAGKAVLAAAVGGTLEQLRHNETALLHAGTCGDGAAAGAEGGFPVSGATPRPNLLDGATASGELARHMCAIATDHALAARLRAAGSAHVRDALGQAHVDAALAAAFS